MSTLLSALFPEAGFTEEKANIGCAVFIPQQQRSEGLLLLLPLTLLRRQLFDQIVAICRAQIKPGLLYCQSQGHLFHVLHVW